MRIAAMLVTIVVAACGGSKSDSTLPGQSGGDSSDGAQLPLDGPVPCEQEIALQCAEGLEDGCLRALTTVHACVPSESTVGPPCTDKLALVCPEGLVDACLVAPAAAEHHVCVVQ
jgi:hypothetical protein